MRPPILFVALVLAACSSSAVGPVTGVRTPAPVAAIAAQQAELKLDIIELTCHSCAGQVAEGTARIPGVQRVWAEILDHILVVRYDPTRLSEASLIAAIEMVVDGVVQ